MLTDMYTVFLPCGLVGVVTGTDGFFIISGGFLGSAGGSYKDGWVRGKAYQINMTRYGVKITCLQAFQTTNPVTYVPL